MLYNIPSILSPELMKVLLEMGHGDEIILADANFPAASLAQRHLYVGAQIPELLNAILRYFPLDQFVDYPVALMDIGSNPLPPNWPLYMEELKKQPHVDHLKSLDDIEMVERQAFFDRTKRAYAVVTTQDTTASANIIIRKGCVFEWQK